MVHGQRAGGSVFTSKSHCHCDCDACGLIAIPIRCFELNAVYRDAIQIQMRGEFLTILRNSNVIEKNKNRESVIEPRNVISKKKIDAQNIVVGHDNNNDE